MNIKKVILQSFGWVKMTDTRLEVIDMEVVDIEQFHRHHFYSFRNKFFSIKKEFNLIPNHYHGQNSKENLPETLHSGSVPKKLLISVTNWET